MKILIVAATALEIQPFLDKIGQKESQFLFGKHEVETLITGVGLMATAYKLGRVLQLKSFDLAINVGAGGAFDRSMELGEVVEIISDQIADEGAEDHEEFVSVSSLGLRAKDEFPFKNEQLYSLHNIEKLEELQLRKLRGISVNKVHGSEKSIARTIERFRPEVETMEGAAFFYSCLMDQVPCLQLRAISNFVEPRNRDGWEMNLALKNLSLKLHDLLKII